MKNNINKKIDTSKINEIKFNYLKRNKKYVSI